LSDILNVVCLKWGTKYSADYVNRLYHMVSRNMTRPFRFHCLTEDPGGLDAGVVPLTLETSPEFAGWLVQAFIVSPGFFWLVRKYPLP